MKKNPFYIAWFFLFLASVVLGPVKPESQMLKAVQVLVAICFFIPPAVLLYDGLKRQDRQQLLRLRLVSGLSLGLTFLLMVANFLSTPLPQWAGEVLYALLIIASAPMACSGFWAASMFAWACVLMTTILYTPKKK